MGLYKKSVFVIENQPYYDKKKARSVVGVKIVDDTLKIRKLKGIDPTVEGFLAVCDYIEKDLEAVNSDYKRKNPYKIDVWTGSSGCKEYYIDYVENIDGFWVDHRNSILYISCLGKIPDQDIFIPDLMLIRNDLKQEYNLENSGIVVRTANLIKTESLVEYILPEGYSGPSYWDEYLEKEAVSDGDHDLAFLGYEEFEKKVLKFEAPSEEEQQTEEETEKPDIETGNEQSEELSTEAEEERLRNLIDSMPVGSSQQSMGL